METLITTTTTGPTISSSLTPSPSSTGSSSNVDIAAIVGGVLGGVIVALVAVAMIVPCARRRQKRFRDPASGNGPRVLRKAGDPEATEPMMNGSWRDRGRHSEEDQIRSVTAGNGTLEPGVSQNQNLSPTLR
jgi:hypothetical protein